MKAVIQIIVLIVFLLRSTKGTLTTSRLLRGILQEAPGIPERKSVSGFDHSLSRYSSGAFYFVDGGSDMFDHFGYYRICRLGESTSLEWTFDQTRCFGVFPETASKLYFSSYNEVQLAEFTPHECFTLSVHYGWFTFAKFENSAEEVKMFLLNVDYEIRDSAECGPASDWWFVMGGNNGYDSRSSQDLEYSDDQFGFPTYYAMNPTRSEMTQSFTTLPKRLSSSVLENERYRFCDRDNENYYQRLGSDGGGFRMYQQWSFTPISEVHQAIVYDSLVLPEEEQCQSPSVLGLKDDIETYSHHFRYNEDLRLVEHRIHFENFDVGVSIYPLGNDNGEVDDACVYNGDGSTSEYFEETSYYNTLLDRCERAVVMKMPLDVFETCRGVTQDSETLAGFTVSTAELVTEFEGVRVGGNEELGYSRHPYHQKMDKKLVLSFQDSVVIGEGKSWEMISPVEYIRSMILSKVTDEDEDQQGSSYIAVEVAFAFPTGGIYDQIDLEFASIESGLPTSVELGEAKVMEGYRYTVFNLRILPPGCSGFEEQEFVLHFALRGETLLFNYRTGMIDECDTLQKFGLHAELQDRRTDPTERVKLTEPMQLRVFIETDLEMESATIDSLDVLRYTEPWGSPLRELVDQGALTVYGEDMGVSVSTFAKDGRSGYIDLAVKFGDGSSLEFFEEVSGEENRIILRCEVSVQFQDPRRSSGSKLMRMIMSARRTGGETDGISPNLILTLDEEEMGKAIEEIGNAIEFKQPSGVAVRIGCSVLLMLACILVAVI